MRQRLRLRDESGIALVMALGIMLVISLTLASLIQFTSANARSANRQNVDQKAFALAEAGVNNALAQLAGHYGTGSSVHPDMSCTSPLPVSGGTVAWCGSLASNVWTVTGTGTFVNPTGPGAAPVVRKATARIALVPAPPEWLKYGLFTDAAAGCTRIAGNAPVTVPIYIQTCLVLAGNGVIEEPPGQEESVSMHVAGGTFRIEGDNAYVGSAAKSIGTVAVRDGCQLKTNPVDLDCQPGSAVKVWGASYRTAVTAPGMPPPTQLPPIDINLVYGLADWAGACTNSAGAPLVGAANPLDNDTFRNRSKSPPPHNAPVQLLQLETFNCTATSAGVTIGRLDWNKSTRRLHIEGTIFIDGSVEIGGGDRAFYTGDGTIYVNGDFKTSGVICGPGSTFNKDVSPYCEPMGWEPSSHSCSVDPRPDPCGNLLFVVCNNSSSTAAVTCDGTGHAADVAGNARMEASIWAAGDVTSGGSTRLSGSVYADNGNATLAGTFSLKALLNLPPGAPSSGSWTLDGTAFDYGG